MSKEIMAAWLALGVFLTLAFSACGNGQISDPDGLPAPVEIRVWVDKNEDGKRTVDELPFAGVAVQLVDPDNGRVVDQQVTDSNGEAEVVGLQALLPGYEVILVVPENFAATTQATIPLAGVDFRSGPISIGIAPLGDS